MLFISPQKADATQLSRMLNGIPLIFDHAEDLAGAGTLLRENHYRAVLTESVLPDGNWLDVLWAVRHRDPEIELIVTSPEVDARFWAEVLNLGGSDMLVQPFSEPEVRHVLSHACARIPQVQPAHA